MKTSELFTINWRDVLRGLAVAAGTGAIDTAIESAAMPPINWKNVGIAAIAGGLAYLKVKFFTPAKVVTPAE